MSIELLIARMETHPEEFFDKDKLLDSESLTIALGSAKWGAVVLRIISMDTGVSGGGLRSLYTDTERDTLSIALNTILRAAVDGEILRAVMTGERFGSESYHRNMKKNAALNAAQAQLKQATMAGQNLLAHEAYRNQAMSNAAAHISCVTGTNITRPVAYNEIACGDPAKESFWKGLLK